MKRRFFVCVLACAGVLAFEAKAVAYVGMVEKIEIRGSEDFVGRVKGALLLIKDRAPQAWGLVAAHVTKIQEGPVTGMFPYAEDSPAVISPETAFCSLSWCAGAIIHNAFHAKLFHEYEAARGTLVPDEAWQGPRAEKECVTFQITAMRQIGAAHPETEYWRGRQVSPQPGPCAGDCPYA